MKITLQTLFFFLMLGQINLAQWNQQTSGTDSHLTGIYFLDNQTGYSVGTGGTILKTTNGGSLWITQNSGVSMNLSSVHFENSTTGWAAGDSLKILKTTNGGTNWVLQSAPGNIHNLNSITFANTLTGWTIGNYSYSPTGSDGVIYKTTNGGSTWYWLEGVMDQKIFSVFFLDQNNGWIAGSTVIKTTDGGLSWGFTENNFFGNEFHSIYFINNSTGWIAGRVTALTGSAGVIMKTTDAGINWTTVYTDSNLVFNSIYFRDGNTGWCTGSSGTILYTTNGGVNWINQPTGTNNLISGVMFPVNDYGWASGYAGTILFTPNAGTPVELISFTAEALNDYILLKWSTATETNNSGFEIQRSTDRINFQTVELINGSGTTTDVQHYLYKDKVNKPGKYNYRLKQIDFNGSYQYSEIIEVDLYNPTQYSLKQNYPNPFNPSTVISFTIPVKEFVILKIYDITGKEVKTLLNNELSPGTYNIDFTAEDLSSGIYFYRIITESFTAVRKMQLLK